MKGEVFMDSCHLPILCELQYWKHRFLPGKLGGWGEILESGLTQQAASGSWVACD